MVHITQSLCQDQCKLIHKKIYVNSISCSEFNMTLQFYCHEHHAYLTNHWPSVLSELHQSQQSSIPNVTSKPHSCFVSAKMHDCVVQTSYIYQQRSLLKTERDGSLMFYTKRDMSTCKQKKRTKKKVMKHFPTTQHISEKLLQHQVSLLWILQGLHITGTVRQIAWVHNHINARNTDTITWKKQHCSAGDSRTVSDHGDSESFCFQCLKGI